MARISAKRKKLIAKVEAQCRLNDERNKAECNHLDHGEMDITPNPDRKQGELKYRCRQCEKQLQFNKVSVEDQNQSCQHVDNMCDIIKMNLNPEKEGDQEVLKTVATVQFFIRNNLRKLYAASLQKNANGRNNRKKGKSNDGYDDSWTPADVGGRNRY